MRIILFTLILLSCGANASVYKCTVNGQTIFQSKPCSGNIGITVGDRIREKEAQNDGKPNYEAQYSNYYESLPEPYIGMSIKEAERTKWGRPDRVSRYKSAKTAHENWYYRDQRYQSKELRFRDGKLTEIRE